MIEADAFERWCDRLQLPTATRDFLLRLRSSLPVRRVQGRLLNICGTYASRKWAKPRYGAVIERLFGTANTQFVFNLQGNTQASKTARQMTKSVVLE